MQVIILAGIPGSGKTTCAETLAKENRYTKTFSVDSFFMRRGFYQFEQTKLGYAHAICLRGYTEALGSYYFQTGGDPPIRYNESVIVDNTNTSLVELSPYVSLAQAYAFTPSIKLFACDPEIAHKRNIHGVPKEIVYKMWAQLQNTLTNWPKFWPNAEIIYTDVGLRPGDVNPGLRQIGYTSEMTLQYEKARTLLREVASVSERNLGDCYLTDLCQSLLFAMDSDYRPSLVKTLYVIGILKHKEESQPESKQIRRLLELVVEMASKGSEI